MLKLTRSLKASPAHLDKGRFGPTRNRYKFESTSGTFSSRNPLGPNLLGCVTNPCPATDPFPSLVRIND